MMECITNSGLDEVKVQPRKAVDTSGVGCRKIF